MARSGGLVLIYGVNSNGGKTSNHIRYRKFTDWVSRNRPDFGLVDVFLYPLKAGKNDVGFYLFKSNEYAEI